MTEIQITGSFFPCLAGFVRGCIACVLRCHAGASLCIAGGLLCTAAFVLGAGQAAAQAIPDQPLEEESAEIVPTVPDTLLARRLRTIFANIEEFSDVTISVSEGVVQLGGNVRQPDERRGAEELAASIEGVVYVVNQVEAATDVETRLSPAVVKIQEFWDELVAQLPLIAVALIVVLIFSLVSILIGRWRRPAGWTGINPLVWGFVSRLVRTIIVLMGLVLAFDILGITSLMGAVLGAAGIIGLALGFAFQDIVENYLAGMLLSLRRPFTVNDLVRIGEHEGRIVRLTSRELVMLTFEGNHVRLPNAHVFKNPLTNFSMNPPRLFSFDIAISLEEDVKSALAAGVEALDALTGVMADPPPFGRMMNVTDTASLLRFFGWVDQREADFYKVRSESIRIVKSALENADISLPAPTYHILMRRPDDEAEAPRISASQRRPIDDTAVDVRPDGRLEAQVREDLNRSDDENLLEQ